MRLLCIIAFFFVIFQWNDLKANDEIEEDQNSKVLYDFTIEFPNENKNNKRSITNENIEFPVNFSVSFNKFDQKVNANFTKFQKHNANIYIIDEKTGQPKLFEIDQDNKIDYELYVQKNNKNGFATLIRNKNCDQNENQFRMLGTVFLSNDVDYVFDITPVKDDSHSKNIKSKKYKKRNIIENSIYHTLHKRAIGTFGQLYTTPTIDIRDDLKDYLILPGSQDLIKNKQFENRKKRGVNSAVKANIEYLVVTDSSIYNDHSRFINSTDPNLIFQHIRIYFTYLVNGVKQRYANGFMDDPDLDINVQVTNFLILTSNVNWADPAVVGDVNYQNGYNGRPVLVTGLTLNAFKNYMNGLNSFSYDHAAAFFNKDLFSDDTTLSAATRSLVSGYASIGGICGLDRYSIIEERGGFSSVLTAAHELGHNLGSYHDGILGISSNCPINDNYIMAPSPSLINNQTNLFDFSDCSILQIKTNILLGNSGIYNGLNQASSCLANAINSQLNETTFATYALAGQIWSPDDQCKMMYGNNASFCRNSATNICSQLSCRANPTDFCITYPGGAADGTTCGSGRVCSLGSCVNSVEAPVSSCPFGDDIIPQSIVGLTLPNNAAFISCASFLAYIQSINQSPNYYCQPRILGSICCQSCLKYNAMSCVDSYFDCPSYKPLCRTATLGGQPLNLVCQRTCGDACKATPLYCTNSSFLCQNGGVCVNQTNVNASAFFGFSCDCPNGFSGELCEIKNPCQPNPCINGICNRIGSLGYLCNCSAGFSGRNCNLNSTLANATTTTTTTTTTITTTTTTTTATSTTSTTTNVAQTTTVSSTTLSTSTTTTISSSSTTSTSTCVNQNDQTCQFYLNLGVKCNSIAYINNLLFSQYCCKTCSATTTTIATTTASSSTTTATLSPVSVSTTTACTNVNDQACQFYLNLGVKCNSASFINNVLFAVYCCKSCSTTTTTTTTPQTTTTTTTTRINSPVTTTLSTTLGTCTNVNDGACSYYISVGVKCSPSSFINSIPFTVYCCKTCNQVVTTTQISTTTLTTTQGNTLCVDSQLSCSAWINYCNILATYNPNPCRKTCNAC